MTRGIFPEVKPQVVKDYISGNRVRKQTAKPVDFAVKMQYTILA